MKDLKMAQQSDQIESTNMRPVSAKKVNCMEFTNYLKAKKWAALLTHRLKAPHEVTRVLVPKPSGRSGKRFVVRWKVERSANN